MNPDVELNAEALLIHREFLMSLSRGLLRDPNEADDLAQDTWLAAVRQPPRTDHNVRGWLKTVATRFAATRRQDSKNRRRWESESAPKETVPSTEAIVERETVRSKVVEAVLSLEALYRDPVFLRYYEDLPPREIARRLDLPVETVRTRLQRGLERLRARLDKDYGGDRDRWMQALAPLAWPEAASLAVTTTLGSKLLLSATVALLLLVPTGLIAFGILPLFTSPSPNTSESATPDAGPSRVAAVLENTADIESTEPRRDVEPLDGLQITGTIRFADGSPASNAEVIAFGIRHLGDINRTVSPAEIIEGRRVYSTSSKDDGSFVLGPLESGLYEIFAWGDKKATLGLGPVAIVGSELAELDEVKMMQRMFGIEALIIREGSNAREDILLDDAQKTSGYVVDSNERPLENAQVVGILPTCLFNRGIPLSFEETLEFLEPLVLETQTNNEGAYDFVLANDSSIAARKDGYYSTRVRTGSQSEKTSTRMVLTPHPHFVIQGVTVDSDQRPVANADVFLGFASDAARRNRVDREKTLDDEIDLLLRLDRPQTKSAGDGTYMLEGPLLVDESPWAEPPESWHAEFRLSAIASGFLATRSAPFTPIPDQPDLPRARSLTLVESLQIRGTVTDATTGQPIQNASVFVESDVDGDGFPFVISSGQTDDMGSFALEGARGELGIQIECEGYETWHDRVTDSKVRATLNPASETIRGHIVDAEGSLVARMAEFSHEIIGPFATSWYDVFRFGFDPSSQYPVGSQVDALALSAGYQAQIDAAGRFEFPDSRLADRAAWLMLVVQGRVEDIRPVGTENASIDFVIDPQKAFALSTLSFTVRDAQGRELDDIEFDVYRQSDHEWVAHAAWVTGSIGTATVQEEGPFDVAVGAPGHGRVIVRDVRIPLGQQRPLETVTLTEERRIEGKVLLSANPSSGTVLNLFDRAGHCVESVTATDEGTFEIGGLGPDRYFLEASSYGKGRTGQWIDLSSASRPDVSLSLEHESWMEFELVGNSPRVRVTILDDHGRVRLSRWISKRVPILPFYFPQGSYSLVLQNGDGIRDRTPIVVTAIGPTRVTVDR